MFKKIGNREDVVVICHYLANELADTFIHLIFL